MLAMSMPWASLGASCGTARGARVDSAQRAIAQGRNLSMNLIWNSPKQRAWQPAEVRRKTTYEDSTDATVSDGAWQTQILNRRDRRERPQRRREIRRYRSPE